MGLLGVVIYVAVVAVILALLVLGAIRSVRLLRSISRGEVVLRGPEALGAVLAVLFLGLLIVGAGLGLLALANSA